MITPLYGQRKTLVQNNYIPMLREHLTEEKKNTRKPKHSIKKMHFIEMFHIEVSVVKPASIIQIPLKFRGQIPYSNTEHVCIHHEKKEKGPWVGPTKVTLSGPVASKREHSAPILPM